MKLERFCVKFLARPEATLDDEALIPIFHGWIRDHKLPGTLLDVADYRHVPTGPGIMLVTHEINYALDRDANELGLYAQLKQPEGDTPQARIVNLVRRTATFGSLLETDQRVAGQIKLDGSSFYCMSNDRLDGPNTDAGFESLKAELAPAVEELYPGKTVTITRKENDPRARLTAVVTVSEPVEMAALAG
ncbi:MAG: hypothetical protein O2890_03535 [Cyanobacteria bacterium]|nr:hypothetical protein [Cyanobacteriota bacterium]MDA0865486.1 hypothetical protein [Cyanobacteriota bacterium]